MEAVRHPLDAGYRISHVERSDARVQEAESGLRPIPVIVRVVHKGIRVMGPSVFGPGWGWGWGLLIGLSVLCLVAGLFGFVLLVLRPAPRKRGSVRDKIWQRIEEDDLPQEDFERLPR